MKTIALVLCILMLCPLCACAAPADPGEILEPEAPAQPQAAKPEAQADLVKQLAANDALAAALIDGMGEDTYVFSPLSIAMTLQLAMYGADETARAAMEAALSTAGIPQAALDLGNRALLEELNAAEGISMANALFANKDCTLDPNFVKTASQDYGAGVGNLDFSNEKAVLEKVNGWIGEHTDGKITGLLKKLSEDSQLLLVNAMALDLKWEREFPEYATNVWTFHGKGGDADVRMMFRTDDFDYAETDLGQFVKLPYTQAGYSMLVALPREGADASACLSALLRDGTGSLPFATRYGGFSMPRVHVEATLDLVSSLTALGMGEAFLGGAGSFPGLLSVQSGDPIQLGQVLHGATMDVSEKGTVATAATIVEAAEGSAMPPEDMFEMHCNRPYAMAILSPGGAVLFAAVVADCELV